MRVGYIGTGVMGSRMVKRLLDHGYQVQVYNRTREKAKTLEEYGAILSDSISALAANCDIICTCLSMPEDVSEVYLGEGGILQHGQEGTICLDLTTVGVYISKTIYAQAAEKGLHYLDSPVSGGPEGAENGSLSIMVGGEKQAFEKVLPLLGVLGKSIDYLGLSGSGSIAKLINQYLVAVHSLAVSEAMVTGAKFGIDSEQLFNILKVSYGDSRILRRHMEGFVLDRNFLPGGAVKYVHKDIRLANKLLEEAGLKVFTGQMAEQAFKTAADKGLNDLDMSAVILPLEEACSVEVKKKTVE